LLFTPGCQLPRELAAKESIPAKERISMNANKKVVIEPLKRPQIRKLRRSSPVTHAANSQTRNKIQVKTNYCGLTTEKECPENPKKLISRPGSEGTRP
jgi:hypothetical protein